MIKENQNLLNKINVLRDVLVLFLSMVISYFIRFTLFYHDEFYIKLDVYLKFTVYMVPVYLILYMFFNLYDPVRTSLFSKECIRVIKSRMFKKLNTNFNLFRDSIKHKIYEKNTSIFNIHFVILKIEVFNLFFKYALPIFSAVY